MKDRHHLYAVILAGGSGTRFWPVSRKKNPKQFLELIGGKTLLELTIRRIRTLIRPANVYIVTNKQYAAITRRHVKKFGVPAGNILLEPAAKNTAPAICWASSIIHAGDPQAVTLVLPSDHLILNEGKFRQAVREAVRLAQARWLVTFGIVPTRPESGYGYLRTRSKRIDGGKVVVVEKFTEKPSLSRARRFIKSRNYFWNSGMFAWKTSVILEEFSKNLPQIHHALHARPRGQALVRAFNAVQGISVDYGILERSSRVAAVPAKDLGWSDLGSWESLLETLARKDGNLFQGEVIDVDTRRSLVYGTGKPVAVVGLDQCLVVDTPDALLVCAKAQSQKVKDLVEILKSRRPELL